MIVQYYWTTRVSDIRLEDGLAYLAKPGSDV